MTRKTSEIMNKAELSKSQIKALQWLADRNGDGVFGEKSNNTVLIAAGERAPIMRGTWNKLCEAGYVEQHGGKRLRLTSAGRAEINERGNP